VFRADWWFGGFVKRDVCVRDFRGGVYYNRGGDQRFLRNWGGFNRGTRTRPRAFVRGVGLGAFGACGFVGASGDVVAELKTLRALERGRAGWFRRLALMMLAVEDETVR
jgi:hypothetical protein